MKKIPSALQLNIVLKITLKNSPFLSYSIHLFCYKFQNELQAQAAIGQDFSNPYSSPIPWSAGKGAGSSCMGCYQNNEEQLKFTPNNLWASAEGPLPSSRQGREGVYAIQKGWGREGGGHMLINKFMFAEVYWACQDTSSPSSCFQLKLAINFLLLLPAPTALRQVQRKRRSVFLFAITETSILSFCFVSGEFGAGLLSSVYSSTKSICPARMDILV